MSMDDRRAVREQKMAELMAIRAERPDRPSLAGFNLRLVLRPQDLTIKAVQVRIGPTKGREGADV